MNFLGYNGGVINEKTGEQRPFSHFLKHLSFMKHICLQFAAYLTKGIILAGFLSVPSQAFSASETFSSQEVADRVNRDRVASGLSPLRIDPTLSDAAAAKAKDMATKEYFSHTSPDGTTPWYFFEKAGYVYRYAGENLAIHFTNAESEESAWMASEKHRENILSPKYVETGIAVAEIPWNGKTTILTVELFGTRFGETIADTSPWKNIPNGSPVASKASEEVVSRERNEVASRVSGPDISTAPLASRTETTSPSSDEGSLPTFSSFLLSETSVRAIGVMALGLIACLEIAAAGIVYRLIFHRASLNSSRNTLPM